MKKKSFQKILLVLSLILVLLLSACQVNFITEFEQDGSGVYTQEIGFESDEAITSGLDPDDEEFCSNQSSTLPTGTTTRKETRNDDSIWCIYETPFDSVEDLQSIYATTDTQINTLSLEDDTLTYDITLDFSQDSEMAIGMDITWKVTMPGKIIDSNATEQKGNTLTWILVAGQMNEIYAVSDVGGSGFDLNMDLGLDEGENSIILTILGSLAGVICCCIVPIVIAGIAILLIRRKKKADVDLTPPQVIE